MVHWQEEERDKAITWFCNHVPTRADTVLTGYQNVNWFKKLISIILNGFKYRCIRKPDLDRILILDSILNQFRINGLKLNLKDTPVGAFPIYLAQFIIQNDMSCKGLNEEGELFEAQLDDVKRKFETNNGWTPIFLNLFTKVYFYVRETAEQHDIVPLFQELFDMDFIMQHFTGPPIKAHDFADFCLDIYARVNLRGI